MGSAFSTSYYLIPTSFMQIGIDASRAQKAEKTGTEWYSFRLIEELKKIPSDNRIILYSKSLLEGDLGRLPSNYENKVLSWWPKYLWTQVRLMWEMLVVPPDVLFTPAHSAPFLSRAKIVITIHDVGFKVLPHLYSWRDKLYHRFSTWWNCKFAWRIIVPSEFTKGELIKYYKVDPTKIQVIYHGTPDPVLKSFPPKGEHFLLFVGRLEKKKNILNIIKAFELVKKTYSDLKLILAGRPGYGFDEVQNYINSSERKNSIETKGYISEEEKWQLYQNAQALVFPTLYEGFGIPITEAQAAGCPVITSSAGANKEIAGDGAILVNPYDAFDIAEAVTKVLGNKGLRGTLIQKGKEYIRRFSWEKTAQQTFEVLVGTGAR